MPHSDAQGKDVALDWYRQIQPRTVVDVGAGAGTYATLLRDDAHEIVNWQGDVHRRVRRNHWTAIEAWQPYVAEFGLDQLYDAVIASDARHLTWPMYKVDLVIAGDVLEHMAREDAKALLRRIRQGAANLIVSIPVLHLPQGAINGNPYERHIDHWTAGSMRNELESYGTVKAEWVGDVLAYFWWTVGVSGDPPAEN